LRQPNYSCFHEPTILTQARSATVGSARRLRICSGGLQAGAFESEFEFAFEYDATASRARDLC
jgi:hypothetical protein